VLLADDHPVFLAGLRSMLGAIPNAEVVGEATTGQGAVAAARRLSPDLVLMDVDLPGINGIEATQKIVAEGTGTAVLVLSMLDDLATILAAMRAGARGYLLKDMDPDRVPVALRGVLVGEAALPRSLMGKVIREFQDRDARPRRRALPANARLSSREWEVADGLGKGLSTNEIADALFIGDNTVRTHIASILRKLRASSREEAVRLLKERADEDK
jgi:DNA-binding NarL/FixJ family response regulator